VNLSDLSIGPTSRIKSKGWFADYHEARHVGRARIVPGARLVEDLGADSLDLVELVFALQDQFGREIGEDETERLGLVTSLP
jgi:acyl carrier protein